MRAASRPILSLAERLEIEDLYHDYTACLDEQRLGEWSGFFTEDCLYKVMPRDNAERGLPLAAILCEGKPYLADRVVAIEKTMMYAPRYVRRIVSGIRPLTAKEGVIELRANFLVLETLLDDTTRVFMSGQYQDTVVRVEGELLFKTRVCVFDTLLVPNSLIYPL